MSYPDFFADLATSGRILGLGLGSRPEDWAAALGDRFFEGSHYEGHLSREFGMLEVNFDGGPGEWSCEFLNVRVEQLSWPPERVPGVAMAPGALRDVYGPFPARVGFDEIADRLADRGVPVYKLNQISAAEPDLFWVADGGAMFHVLTPATAGDGLRPGDIHSVSVMSGRTIRVIEHIRYR